LGTKELNLSGARTEMSPDEVLRRLIEGNERFAGDRAANPAPNLKDLRQRTAAKQEPFATVLSCVDSRVPVELVFDQTIGQLVVARVAGNIATREIVASLEYGAAVLGTKVILVLGHSSCGAVTAVQKRENVPGQIGALFPYIRPAVMRSGGDLETAVKENAKSQAETLRKSSPLLSGLEMEGKLKVVAGYYELATGRVSLLPS
jgi:carbonic anhydrase